MAIVSRSVNSSVADIPTKKTLCHPLPVIPAKEDLCITSVIPTGVFKTNW